MSNAAAIAANLAGCNDCRPGEVPPPEDCGHLPMSFDGINWVSVKPVVGIDYSWLNNAQGDLLVEGWHLDG